MKNNKTKSTMESISSLCKRRGFIFQSSEIYGGINGFWDYGPLGTELKRNIRGSWWRNMVRQRENVVGLDASIIMHPKVWEASGHIGGFQDPMVDCRETKSRYRADQIMVFRPKQDDGKVCLVAFHEGHPEEAEKRLRKAARCAPGDCDVLSLENLPLTDYTRLLAPDASEPGTLTEPRAFNLMFKTYVGPLEDASAVAYLRPETAQGIFAQFANVCSVSRQKLPFGIAQIGKAFRNEINPRNYTFRSREFEQMELEFFIDPGSDAKWHAYWVEERLKWYQSIGLPEAALKLDVHPKEKLAHYASACTDIMYDFPFGVQELEGIAARGDFDLKQHQQFSGKSMEYFDQENNRRFLPHVVEPSAGVDRIALALICNAYAEEWVPKDKDNQDILPANPEVEPPNGYELRTVMKFHPSVAPIKAAVFPLLKNKPELVAKARDIFSDMQARWECFYDQTGAIGRRYRRQDEIGTPFGITVDFETLEDHTVTLRHRDSMDQERIPVDELIPRLSTEIGYTA